MRQTLGLEVVVDVVKGGGWVSLEGAAMARRVEQNEDTQLWYDAANLQAQDKVRVLLLCSALSPHCHRLAQAVGETDVIHDRSPVPDPPLPTTT